LKEAGELYLVVPALWSSQAGESTFGPRKLVSAINRQGVLFLWPLRTPDPDGKRADEWSRSAQETVELARTSWVRVAANMSLGAYEPSRATGSIPEPEWPALPLRDAGRLPGKAFAIGMVLWREVGAKKMTVPFNISRSGFPRTTTTRALQALADAGLVRVARRHGRPPLLTVVDNSDAGCVPHPGSDGDE
jgi:hypothetical protein